MEHFVCAGMVIDTVLEDSLSSFSVFSVERVLELDVEYPIVSSTLTVVEPLAPNGILYLND